MPLIARNSTPLLCSGTSRAAQRILVDSSRGVCLAKQTQLAGRDKGRAATISPLGSRTSGPRPLPMSLLASQVVVGVVVAGGADTHHDCQQQVK